MATPSNSVNLQTGTAGTLAFHNHLRSASGQWHRYNDTVDTHGYYSGVGSPEGVVAADIGSIYTDTGVAANGIYYKTTDTVNTGWVLQASTGSFSVVNQTFTANGTYTPTVGMVYCEVQCVGGGGGSGGTAATGGATGAASGGGGGAEYASGIFSAATIGVSQAVTIGAAGTGGAAGNNAGTAGANTSLGALLSAFGGGAGAGSPTAASTLSAGGTGGTGGAGGSVRYRGQEGQQGYSVFAAGAFHAGAGGSSSFGWGGASRDLSGVASTATGPAGTGFGSGGAGSAATNLQAALAGTSGSAGFMVVREYVIS